jgi:hypothetical protein
MLIEEQKTRLNKDKVSLERRKRFNISSLYTILILYLTILYVIFVYVAY